MTTTRALILSAVAFGAVLVSGCGNEPPPGQPYEKPAANSGTAKGRLNTDQGAEAGVGGGGVSTPAAEPAGG